MQTSVNTYFMSMSWLRSSLVARNAKTDNCRVSTLRFLDFFELFHGENQDEILDIVIVNQVVYVRIIRQDDESSK